MVLLSPKGMKILYAIKLEFKATNNQVEYEVLIAGLNLALIMKVEEVHI